MHYHRQCVNIGGAKIWVTNIGGAKIYGKYIFKQNSQKNLEKNPKKFLMTFFSHRQLFKQISTLHSKFTPFSLYFSFFVSLSAFFHVFLLKDKKIKNSRLIIGGQKGVLPPS